MNVNLKVIIGSGVLLCLLNAVNYIIRPLDQGLLSQCLLISIGLFSTIVAVHLMYLVIRENGDEPKPYEFDKIMSAIGIFLASFMIIGIGSGILIFVGKTILNLLSN